MLPIDLTHSYFLWLMPQKDVLDEFHQTILDLSRTYQTPPFEPHLTLVTGLSGDEHNLIEGINAFAVNKHILTVTLEGIDYAQGFFTGLFLRAHDTPELNHLNQQARSNLQPFGQEPYQPHLSLLYGEVTTEEIEKIKTRLDQSPKTFNLIKLKLVKGHPNVTLWRPIKEWTLSR